MGGASMILDCKNGAPIPSAICEDRRRLSPKATNEILKLMRPAPHLFIVQAAWAWMVIVSAFLVAEYFRSIPLTIIAIYVIGTRQIVLGLLVHEQIHSVGFKSAAGTLFANITAGYPLLMSVETFRGVHLEHHRHFFTDRDPDYLRKQGKEWTFPQQGRELLKSFLRDATGLSLLKFLKSKHAAKDAETTYGGSGTPRVRVAYYIVIAALLTATHHWTLFLLYWFVPLLTVFQVLVRWNAICEHKYDLVAPSVAESTPLICLKWWERILLPNLNFTYHTYHHYYPGVPSYWLPRIHEIYCKEGLVREEHVFHGYYEYLKFLLAIPARTAGNSELKGAAHEWERHEMAFARERPN
jgi:fatty acid desaturase